MATFRPEHCATALMICRLGGSDTELAAALDCTLRDVHVWQTKYEQFAEACKVGSEQANERVKRSLYHRAVGYEFEETKLHQFQGEVIETVVTTRMHSDVAAAKYWLENQDPENWSSKTKSEITGKDGAPLLAEDSVFVLEDLNDDELAVLGKYVERKTAES